GDRTDHRTESRPDSAAFCRLARLAVALSSALITNADVFPLMIFERLKITCKIVCASVRHRYPLKIECYVRAARNSARTPDSGDIALNDRSAILHRRLNGHTEPVVVLRNVCVDGRVQIAHQYHSVRYQKPSDTR